MSEMFTTLQNRSHLSLAACGLALLLTFASCETKQTTEPSMKPIGKLTDNRIKEASGLIASRRYPGVFWTHNDGDDGGLFAIRRDGSLIGAAKIDAKLRDWEDITLDNDGRLYIADVGNNAEKRKHVTIHRLAEPDPEKLKTRKPEKIEPTESWKIEFPDDSFDIESLFVRGNRGYLVMKVAHRGDADVFQFELSDVDEAGKKRDKKQKMTKAFTLPGIRARVTAADLRADGKALAVLTRGELWVFPVNDGFAVIENATPQRFALPPAQVEGCAFGEREILVVAESREIFAVPTP